MSKHHWCNFDRIGYIITYIGIGMLLTFIIPFWGYIIAAGVSLIYLGCHIIKHH